MDLPNQITATKLDTPVQTLMKIEPTVVLVILMQVPLTIILSVNVSSTKVTIYLNQKLILNDRYLSLSLQMILVSKSRNIICIQERKMFDVFGNFHSN